MNRYISIFLVIIAANAAGAQVLSPSIAVSSDYLKYEDEGNLCQLYDIKADIMSVIKWLQAETSQKSSDSIFDLCSTSYVIKSINGIRKPPEKFDVSVFNYCSLVKSSISIRAPGKFII